MLLVLILVLIILSALFSGAEIAFVSANKLGIEVLKNKGHARGKMLADFYDKPREFLSTMLVGNNIVLVLLTMFASQLIEPYFVSYFPDYFPQGSLFLILVVTLIITVVVLIFAEFLPKTISRLYANEMLYKFTYIVKFFIWLLAIPTWFMTKLSSFVLKYIFGAQDDLVDDALSRMDLEDYINESVHEEQDIDKEILTNALNLGTLKVRDCQIPRNEIIYINKSDTVDDAINLFREHRLSRIIVIDEDLENVVGYIHHQQLLNNPKKIEKLILPITFVPEAMVLPETMRKFILERTNIAIVVDEFGGVSGLITLEDILEEIFGEIEDEHDTEDFIEERLSDEEFRFAGRLEIGYLNEKYPELGFAEGDYQTLSGMIVSYEQNIPDQGDEISIGDYLFTIELMSDTRIEVVTVKRIHSAQANTETDN